MQFFLSLFVLYYYFVSNVQSQQRSFTVDYDENTFIKDGQPFRYISGTLHYFQVPYTLWQDRMQRARAVGLIAIQTYIDWSKHELYQGQYDFSFGSNITEYFELAHNLGMLVILRVGPYIDAEQDFGGFPYWLLKYPNITLRSSADQRYLDAVEKWFSVLLPKIRPLLYSNGGPIIMVQVENEYGSYGCDKNYTSWLYGIMMKYLQDQVVYFTTDGTYTYMIQCGQVNGTLTTIDFGVASQANVASYFNNLRQFMPKGPLVNSEFYPGWQDEWWQPTRSTTPSQQVTDTMKYMWNLNASFNIYPIHGGTNWGYQAGGEYPTFKTICTEYDFDAPISEAGDVTDKYLDVRNTVENLTGQAIQYPVPQNSTKFNYGKVLAQYIGSIFDLLSTLTKPNSLRQSTYPMTFEDLDQPYGFVLYQSKLSSSGQNLSINDVRDRAYIMVDYQLVQVIQRGSNATKSFVLGDFESGSMVHILVENQGRICYGSGLADNIGIISNVTLDGNIITGWTMYPLTLENLNGHNSPVSRKSFYQQISNTIHCSNAQHIPSFYVAYFSPTTIGDTFLNTTGWGKGQLLLNEINIGRYWPVAGPQMSLYIPATYLKSSNQIAIFELDHPGNCADEQNNICYFNFVDQPIYK